MIEFRSKDGWSLWIIPAHVVFVTGSDEDDWCRIHFVSGNFTDVAGRVRDVVPKISAAVRNSMLPRA